MGAHSKDDDKSDAPITRGGQPLEEGVPGEQVVAAEEAHEAEISKDREQIGTTRGGQPIESMKHSD